MFFPRVVWSSGGLILTNDRLGVAWQFFGWLVFMIGSAWPWGMRISARGSRFYATA